MVKMMRKLISILKRVVLRWGHYVSIKFSFRVGFIMKLRSYLIDFYVKYFINPTLKNEKYTYKNFTIIRSSIIIFFFSCFLFIGLYLFQFELSFYLFPEYIIGDLNDAIERGALILRNANYTDINGYIFPDMHYSDKMSLAVSSYFLIKYRKYVRKLQLLRRWRSTGLDDDDMVSYVHPDVYGDFMSWYYPYGNVTAGKWTWYFIGQEIPMYNLRLFLPSSKGSRKYIFGTKNLYFTKPDGRLAPYFSYEWVTKGELKKKIIRQKMWFGTYVEERILSRPYKVYYLSYRQTYKILKKKLKKLGLTVDRRLYKSVLPLKNMQPDLYYFYTRVEIPKRKIKDIDYFLRYIYPYRKKYYETMEGTSVYPGSEFVSSIKAKEGKFYMDKKIGDIGSKPRPMFKKRFFVSIKRIHGFDPHDIFYGVIRPNPSSRDLRYFRPNYRTYLLPFLRTDDFLINEDADVNPFRKLEFIRDMYYKRGARESLDNTNYFGETQMQYYPIWTRLDRNLAWHWFTAMGFDRINKQLFSKRHRGWYRVFIPDRPNYRVYFRSYVDRIPIKYSVFMQLASKDPFVKDSTTEVSKVVPSNPLSADYGRYRRLFNLHHLSQDFVQSPFLDKYFGYAPVWFLSPFRKNVFFFDYIPSSGSASSIYDKNRSGRSFDKLHLPNILRYHIQADIEDEAYMQQMTNQAVKEQIINDHYNVDKDRFIEFYKKLPLSASVSDRLYFENMFLKYLNGPLTYLFDKVEKRFGIKDVPMPYRENFGINAGINAVNQKLLSNMLYNRISRAADDSFTNMSYFYMFTEDIMSLYQDAFYHTDLVNLVFNYIGIDIMGRYEHAWQYAWWAYYAQRFKIGLWTFPLDLLNYIFNNPTRIYFLLYPDIVRTQLRQRFYERGMYRMLLSRVVDAKIGPDSYIMSSNDIPNFAHWFVPPEQNPEIWNLRYIQGGLDRKYISNENYHSRFASYYYNTFPEKRDDRKLPHQNLFLELFRKYNNASYDYFSYVKRIEPFVFYHEAYQDSKPLFYRIPQHQRIDYIYREIMEGSFGDPNDPEADEPIKIAFKSGHRAEHFSTNLLSKTFRRFLSKFVEDRNSLRQNEFFDRTQPTPFPIERYTQFGPKYVVARKLSPYYRESFFYNNYMSEGLANFAFRELYGATGWDDENLMPSYMDLDYAIDYGYSDPFNNEFLLNRNRFNMANDAATGVYDRWDTDRWATHYSQTQTPFVQAYMGDKSRDQTFYTNNTFWFDPAFVSTHGTETIDAFYPYVDSREDDPDRATFWEIFFTRYKYKPKNFYFNYARLGEFRKYFLDVDNRFGTFLFYKDLDFLSSIFFNFYRVYQFFVTDQDVKLRFKNFSVNFDHFVDKYMPFSFFVYIFSYVFAFFSLVFSSIFMYLVSFLKIWYNLCFNIFYAIFSNVKYIYYQNKFMIWLMERLYDAPEIIDHLAMFFSKYIYSQYAELFQYLSYLSTNVFTYFSLEGFESFFRILVDIFVLDYKFWFVSAFAYSAIVIFVFFVVQYFRDDLAELEDPFEHFWTNFLIITFALLVVACMLSGFDRLFVDLIKY